MADFFTEGSSSRKKGSVHSPDQKTPVNQSVDNLSQLFDFISKKKLRRVDHFSRMALLAAGKALEDTDPELICKDDLGIIMATGFGALQTTFAFLDSYVEKGDKLASPTHFSNSVHNAAAAHVSICYGITGPNLTVSQFDMSFISALITASAWLEEKKITAVLFGTCDSFCDVLGYCIDAFSTRKNKHSYSFGESAAFFLLTREEKKPKYGYFDEISIGNFNNEDLDYSDNNFWVLSPSAIEPCTKKAEQFIKRQKNIIYRNQMFSPTDCSMNVFFAKNQNKKFNYMKIGQNGGYGRMVFSPI